MNGMAKKLGHPFQSIGFEIFDFGTQYGGTTYYWKIMVGGRLLGWGATSITFAISFLNLKRIYEHPVFILLERKQREQLLIFD